MTYFTPAAIRCVKRVSVHSNDKPVMEPFVDIEQYGKYESNYLAKKAVVLLYHPELKDSSEEHIKRISKQYFVGKDKWFKVVKV